MATKKSVKRASKKGAGAGAAAGGSQAAAKLARLRKKVGQLAEHLNQLSIKVRALADDDPGTGGSIFK